MGKYGGSWAEGFASTFDPIGGINLGLQWKEKKAAKKKIDDAVEQLKINSMELAAKFDAARANGSIDQQEYGDAMAWAIPLGKEITGKVNDLYTNYQSMTPDQLKTELGNIDAMFKFSEELDFTNLEQMKEFGSKLTQTDAKMQWDLIIKSIEGREKPVAETKEPTISDYGTGLKYLTNIAKISPENWETARKGLESKFGFDYSGITQESLKETEMGDEVFNLYNTPEEVMTNVKPSAGLTVMPKRDTKTGKYYASFSKETITEPTPPKPETVTTLKNWEEMFDIKSEEGPKTEEEYNRALDLLAQSEDVYKPIYTSWKEALISEVKGIGKELKGITEKEDFNLLLSIYMQKLEEIKTKYPEVNLEQFPEFEEQKSWFEKLKEKVGL